jgi:hypothetical protein
MIDSDAPYVRLTSGRSGPTNLFRRHKTGTTYSEDIFSKLRLRTLGQHMVYRSPEKKSPVEMGTIE